MMDTLLASETGEVLADEQLLSELHQNCPFCSMIFELIEADQKAHGGQYASPLETRLWVAHAQHFERSRRGLKEGTA